MNPSFAIKKGLAEARKLTGISFLNLVYNPGLDSWCLSFRIQRASGDTQFVRSITDWMAIIPSHYPLGSVEIFPASINGLSHTFPHQEYNAPRKEGDWRSGKICVNVPKSAWGRKSYSREPREKEKKLVWHLSRVAEWTDKAAVDRLVEYGDPFELPALPDTLNSPIAFNETATSFAVWNATKGFKGTVELAPLLAKDSKHSVCITFRSNKGEVIDQHWGTFLSTKVADHRGVWEKTDLTELHAVRI